LRVRGHRERGNAPNSTGSGAGSTPAPTTGRVQVFFSYRIVAIVASSFVLNLGKEALMVMKRAVTWMFEKLSSSGTHPADGSTAPYAH
jgi:hypothetical protein